MTIPVAVLFRILVGFGRLSATGFVAMPGWRWSLVRLLRPVAYRHPGHDETAYETIVALPDSNQSFEIAVSVATDRRERIARVFFEDFPHRVIYVGTCRLAADGAMWS